MGMFTRKSNDKGMFDKAKRPDREVFIQELKKLLMEEVDGYNARWNADPANQKRYFVLSDETPPDAFQFTNDDYVDIEILEWFNGHFNRMADELLGVLFDAAKTAKGATAFMPIIMMQVRKMEKEAREEETGEVDTKIDEVSLDEPKAEV